MGDPELSLPVDGLAFALMYFPNQHIHLPGTQFECVLASREGLCRENKMSVWSVKIFSLFDPF